MKLAVKVADCKVWGGSHNRTACNMLRRLFCGQLQIKHQFNKKVRESCLILSGVLSSAVHSWWVSCLTASNQPAAPWQTSLCMSHHMEHVIFLLMHARTHAHTHTHTHTHVQSHSSARGFPPRQCITCVTKSLTSVQKRESPFVFECGVWVHACVSACASVFGIVYTIGSVSGCVNGSVLIFLQGHRLMKDDSSGWRPRGRLAGWWFTLQ